MRTPIIEKHEIGPSLVDLYYSEMGYLYNQIQLQIQLEERERHNDAYKMLLERLHPLQP